MKNSVVIVALLVAVAVVLLFAKPCRRGEGYYRDTPLGAQCSFQRTPVDYESDLAQDPQYQANPHSYRAPLNQFPVDFHADLRTLDQPKDYSAPQSSAMQLPRDSKTHADLVWNGDIQLDKCLFHHN